ncbi:DUF4038 domain-containing protein [Deinococcus pimensis]|uniref:apiosidase-like domain-containing protein n=1 Tax=Deinococcus pimensis TaxID=309888 RepID=UPI0004BA055E|nr:DUF4038 domain-containing protein [Deinococcus pimensis]
MRRGRAGQFGRAWRALLALTCAVLAARPTVGAPEPPGPVSGATYALLSACGGRSLDIRKMSLDDGAAAQTWTFADTPNQHWALTDAGEGTFVLTAQHSDRVLDVSGAARDAGTPVIQWRALGAPNQRWRVLNAGDGTVKLAPLHAPNLRLAVEGERESDGAAVRVAGDAPDCGQRWTLRRVSWPGDDSRLRVSPDGHSLVRSDGAPFVYLADTAWELLHRLDREEARAYLRERAAGGFNVVQTVALAELDGPGQPNAYGDLPLTGRDPARPAVTPGASAADAGAYDYWDHVDFVVREAASLGLRVALLPSWGSWVSEAGLFTPASARAYGLFLGRRYRDAPIIWMVGGDRPPDARAREVWRAMALGIEEGVGGRARALISFHPPVGHSSSTWFHADDWLDFSSWQTGHCRGLNEWDLLRGTAALLPRKPVLNAEPIYERHPVCFDAARQGHSDDVDVRVAAYRSVFSGALGHTYGHHSVWQMHAPGRAGVNGPLVGWREALAAPGAAQMRHLRALLESRPFLEREPASSLLVNAPGGPDGVFALRGRTWAMIYSAVGRPFGLSLTRLGRGPVRASWFDPRTGRTTPVTVVEGDVEVFTPPSAGRGRDWALLLDVTDRP